MTKAIYLDCFSGISGDMLVGALLDAGLSLASLQGELSKLSVKNFSPSAFKVMKGNIAATKFEVNPGHEQAHRHLSHIVKIIRESELADRVKERAEKIFTRLAEAEAKVHGTTPEKIHFHEVGAIDSIVDIVGACIGFELLGVERFYCSPLNVGQGTISCAHGILPVPVPATAELLKEVPVFTNRLEGELVTPTGAAIVSTLCDSFGGLPAMKIGQTGFGAGTKDFQGSANVLRVLLGELDEESISCGEEKPHGSVVVLEANIDDMNPQIFGYLQEKLFELGVLDVYSSPVQMKKNRPGTLLSVVVPDSLREAAAEMLFRETTTIGIRYYEADRMVLEREMEQIQLPGGTVGIKVSRLEGKIVNFTPEYEDCRKIAAACGVSFKVVSARAIQQFLNRHPDDIIG
jgi:hypothetical protein